MHLHDIIRDQARIETDDLDLVRLLLLLGDDGLVVI
jgi:hypothetical protein